MLEPGLYDQLITDALLGQLDDTAVTAAVDDAETPSRYAAHVHRVLAKELPGVDADQRHRIVTELLRSLGAHQETPTDPLRLLRGVPHRNSLGASVLPVAPDVPLSQHDLLVNARGEPQLANELKKEIASADQVDLIVAFVRWYGVRLIVEELEDALDRGAEVRLLTTTYTGSTEAEGARPAPRRSASRSGSPTTPRSPACMPRRGSSIATPGSRRPTSAPPTSHGQRCSTVASGTSASRSAASPALFDKVATAFDAHWASATSSRTTRVGMPSDSTQRSVAVGATTPAMSSAD